MATQPTNFTGHPVTFGSSLRSGTRKTEGALAFATGDSTLYVNRVWDLVAADFVRWETGPQPDNTGANYPGPDAFGNTLDYAVELVK